MKTNILRFPKPKKTPAIKGGGEVLNFPKNRRVEIRNLIMSDKDFFEVNR